MPWDLVGCKWHAEACNSETQSLSAAWRADLGYPVSPAQAPVAPGYFGQTGWPQAFQAYAVATVTYKITQTVITIGYLSQEKRCHTNRIYLFVLQSF